MQLLKAAVETGHRIGDLIELENVELAELSRENKPRKPGRTARFRSKHDVTIDQRAIEEVVEFAATLNGPALERSLSVQYRLLGPCVFREIFCCRLLTRVGVLWEEGRLSIAAEHLVSAVVKGFLLRTLDLYRPAPHAPKILFTTPAEEQHELGLLMAAGVAAELGAETINLGPQLPADAVASAAIQAEVSAVALSAIHMAVGAQRDYLRRLRVVLPERIEVWVGGSNAVADLDGCLVLDLDQMATRVEKCIQESADHI